MSILTPNALTHTFPCQDHHDPTQWLRPRPAFFAFPARSGLVQGILLSCSLFLFRIPGIYYSYPSLNNYGDDELKNPSLFTYNNAMLLVVLMILPIGFFTLYYSVAYMLFRKEFTASPGK
ncbi:hypothetical protein EON64_14425 [archaeon]|nr:MAG: hypothetical protein EON64_14425 [archaeon]